MNAAAIIAGAVLLALVLGRPVRARSIRENAEHASVREHAATMAALAPKGPTDA